MDRRRHASGRSLSFAPRDGSQLTRRLGVGHQGRGRRASRTASSSTRAPTSAASTSRARTERPERNETRAVSHEPADPTAGRLLLRLGPPTTPTDHPIRLGDDRVIRGPRELSSLALLLRPSLRVDRVLLVRHRVLSACQEARTANASASDASRPSSAVTSIRLAQVEVPAMHRFVTWCHAPRVGRERGACPSRRLRPFFPHKRGFGCRGYGGTIRACQSAAIHSCPGGSDDGRGMVARSSAEPLVVPPHRRMGDCAHVRRSSGVSRITG